MLPFMTGTYVVLVLQIFAKSPKSDILYVKDWLDTEAMTGNSITLKICLLFIVTTPQSLVEGQRPFRGNGQNNVRANADQNRRGSNIPGGFGVEDRREGGGGGRGNQFGPASGYIPLLEPHSSTYSTYLHAH